jgi:hypothetical protein
LAILDEYNDAIKEKEYKHSLSVKTSPAIYERFWVPEAVYTYVKQLETAIKYNHFEGIERQYPEKFANRKDGVPPEWVGML